MEPANHDRQLLTEEQQEDMDCRRDADNEAAKHLKYTPLEPAAPEGVALLDGDIEVLFRPGEDGSMQCERCVINMPDGSVKDLTESRNWRFWTHNTLSETIMSVILDELTPLFDEAAGLKSDGLDVAEDVHARLMPGFLGSEQPVVLQVHDVQCLYEQVRQPRPLLSMGDRWEAFSENNESTWWGEHTPIEKFANSIAYESACTALCTYAGREAFAQGGSDGAAAFLRQRMEAQAKMVINRLPIANLSWERIREGVLTHFRDDEGLMQSCLNTVAKGVEDGLDADDGASMGR